MSELERTGLGDGRESVSVYKRNVTIRHTISKVMPMPTTHPNLIFGDNNSQGIIYLIREKISLFLISLEINQRKLKLIQPKLPPFPKEIHPKLGNSWEIGGGKARQSGGKHGTVKGCNG